jgi:drug/metabolite transporter (DMT)-like permease
MMISSLKLIDADSLGGIMWITLYFAANIALTLHNKSILSQTEFDFPWSLTALHSVASAVGSAVCLFFFNIGRFTDVHGWRHWAWLAAFSLLYTVNIGTSLVSMSLVLLSFHQTVRSLTPLFTSLLEYFALGKSISPFSALALIPVVCGVALACYGEMGFTALGAVLTFTGVLLSAAKGVSTHLLLVGELRLDPFDLLFRMSLMCTLQCIVCAWLAGELAAARQFLVDHENASVVTFQLASNAALAFGLSYLSLMGNKSTSSLSMSVVGNVKQAVLIPLTVWLFSDVLSAIQWVGVVMTLAGGAVYSYSKNSSLS